MNICPGDMFEWRFRNKKRPEEQICWIGTIDNVVIINKLLCICIYSDINKFTWISNCRMYSNFQNVIIEGAYVLLDEIKVYPTIIS